MRIRYLFAGESIIVFHKIVPFPELAYFVFVGPGTTKAGGVLYTTSISALYVSGRIRYGADCTQKQWPPGSKSCKIVQ